ncbi:MAG: DUF2764 family protein [Treponema sp.]|nr:DUF2764 family protein [Treponema sp.]
MRGWYYLMAQLPSFSTQQTAPLPISEEYFLDLCSRFLDKKTYDIVSGISLEPPRTCIPTGSAFLDSYYDWERKLRFSLASIRAQKMKKEFNLPQDLSFAPDIVQIARTASGFDSPLETEQFLNESRMNAVRNFTPSNYFSTDSVFSYALQLKLATRIKQFNEEAGLASYRMIYDQILGEST